MAITHEDAGESFRRIALSGRLDARGTEEIAQTLAALAAEGGRRVVLDLTAVSFFASAAIRAVLAGAKAAERNGGRMVLYVGSNPAVTRTLEAAGMDVLIPIFADAGEADKAARA